MSDFQLHHQGYLTANLEKSAAMFEQRFGYQRESAVIHDPVQTARVIFLRLPRGCSWLELVQPDGESSKLASSLKKRGEGWHHVCYEVTDIAAAGNALRDQGMLCVCEPVVAAAFPGRCISWFMDANGLLVELLENGNDLGIPDIHLSVTSLVKQKGNQ